jgi:hypothetical protein
VRQCGYRGEPVDVPEILTAPLWDDSVASDGIRSVWSRPLFGAEGRVVGTFAMLYREVRKPAAIDLRLVENASRIAGIAMNVTRMKQPCGLIGIGCACCWKLRTAWHQRWTFRLCSKHYRPTCCVSRDATFAPCRRWQERRSRSVGHEANISGLSDAEA